MRPNQSSIRIRMQDHLARWRSLGGLPFSSAFSAGEIADALDAGALPNARDNGPFTREDTLFTFLSQVLHDDSSCRSAVARFNADRLARNLDPVSSHTSSYCKARERLPVGLSERLCRQCANAVGADVPRNWLWHGRRVRIVDGTMLTAPDTPASRLAYPQYHAFRANLGFPSLRLVAMTSLESGMVVDAAFAAYEGGTPTTEHALSRQLVGRNVSPGDIVVGDRLYDSYTFVATVLGAGGDFVGRLRRTKSQRFDFRRGHRLGREDHVVTLTKPCRSLLSHLDDETFNALPDTISLRIVKVSVTSPGRRTKVMYVGTTLTSAKDYPVSELADLYRQRWQIEVDLRAIKQDMLMEHLTCRTPTMLGKEIWTRLLAYNLIRRTMAQVAVVFDRRPRELSFAASVQMMTAYMTVWKVAEPKRRLQVYKAMLLAIAAHPVGNRPGRNEPRQVKRALNRFDLLRQPRSTVRRTLGIAS